MKTLLALITLAVMTSAYASELPDTAFEPSVLVKEITQRGNLMPGPGVRRLVYTTIEVDVKFCRNMDEKEFNIFIEHKDIRNVVLTIKAKNAMVDCYGPTRLQTLVFETTQVPAHVSIRLGNSLLTETQFVY